VSGVERVCQTGAAAGGMVASRVLGVPNEVVTLLSKVFPVASSLSVCSCDCCLTV
jgi:hypothetical protein